MVRKGESTFFKSEREMNDVNEPNLMTELFPFTQAPRITFDEQAIPMRPAREMWITDTTFRDGQQSRAPFTPEQITTIYRMLHLLGGPRGIIRQSEFFLYSMKDRLAVEKCLEMGLPYPEVTGWIRANPEDLKLVRDMGLRETGMLMSASDYHIFLKLKKTRQQALEDYLSMARSALEMGIVCRCHLEDITRADVYGFCVPLVQELMELSREAGIDVKIRLCDTLGLGVDLPNASLPRGVPKLINVMIEEAGVPGHLLEWHGHNDFHKALANASAAWLYGCAGANGTLFGIGERTGNTPIEALIFEMMGLLGDVGAQTQLITELAEYFQQELGIELPRNMPFVGEDFNTTAAGIHADGMMKDQKIYSIFDTEKLLNRKPSITITDKSGAAGVAYWINSYARLEPSRAVSKHHPGIGKILKWIEEQYEAGRASSISNKEMAHLARRYLPELFLSEFDILKFRGKAIAEKIVEEQINNPDIRSMEPQKQKVVLEKLLEKYPFIQFAYVTDSKGIRLTPTVIHQDESTLFQKAVPGEDCSDRLWFQCPMRNGKIYTMNFYISRYTGALCITVSGPIRDDAHNIVGILGIDIRFEDLVKMEEITANSSGKLFCIAEFLKG